jgi:hypothetical protein
MGLKIKTRNKLDMISVREKNTSFVTVGEKTQIKLLFAVEVCFYFIYLFVYLFYVVSVGINNINFYYKSWIEHRWSCVNSTHQQGRVRVRNELSTIFRVVITPIWLGRLRSRHSDGEIVVITRVLLDIIGTTYQQIGPDIGMVK